MTVGRATGRAAAGEAGRRGEEVRSDVWVRIEMRAQGGIELRLESRVEAYYGDDIRAQVGELMQVLGVEHALVEMEDTGALPFVIAARLESAVRATGIEPAGDARPAATAPATPPSPKERRRRSRLYLPGNEPKFFLSAGLYRPDGIILDLEDSVHADHKDAARRLVRNALRVVDFMGVERMVRINQLPLGLEDLAAIVPERPDMILIPKVESAEQVRKVDAEIARLLDGAARGEGSVADRSMWLMPIVESALGIEHAFEIASACTRVAALTVGLEDYSADLGVPRSAVGVESDFARKRVVNAARAAGVQAIDSVYSDVDDVEGLEHWTDASKQLGFEGMGCLHPRQIDVIHGAFRPSADQIEHAVAIAAAYADAQARGLGVVSLGSKMIDPPVLKQALRLVEQARELGLLPEGDASAGETP